MAKLVLMKALFNKSEVLKRADDSEKLEQFRKRILDYLDSIDGGKEEEAVQKAFSSMLRMEKGGKGLAIGTVREWKGKKFKKISPGKWRPVYDSETRGAKMAVSAIKRKIAAAPDAHAMMQIILENRDRFSDKNGQPLPFVQELSKYVAAEQDKRDQAVIQQRKEKPDRKKAEREESESRKFKASGEFSEAYKNGEITAGTAVYKMVTQGISEKEAREAIGIPKDYAGSVDNWDRDQKRKAGKAVNPGDMYVDRSLENRKMFAVRIVSKNGNDGYKAALGGTGVERGMGGIMEFDTKEEAQKWINEHPNKPEGKPRKEKIDVDKPVKKNDTFVDSLAGIERAEEERYKSLLARDEETRAEYQSMYGEVKSKPADELVTAKNDGWVWITYKKGYEVHSTTAGGAKRKLLNGIKDMIDKYDKVIANWKEKIEESHKRSESMREKQPVEKSDFEKIQERYKNADSEEGDEDEVQAGKETIAGKWKLVEADTPAASHDETTFHKTPGFPTNEDGSTINDRDYGHDKEAQEIILEIGADYDGRAVSVDNPVIVTKDGIVISGNNRTMSGKIAARKGSDKGYIEALKRKAKKFGFTPEQVGQFKHPRVIFEAAENKGYSTDQFAKFNKSSKKAMSPIEAAVKVSKTVKNETVESIAGKMSAFETLGGLYADRSAVNEIFNTLQRDNIITSMDRPQYVVDGGITGAGKEFLETVLIGSVINESNIRGLNREGCKSIRQKLVRAITPLIENKVMDGYSITKELNDAVDIAMQIAVQKDKFKSIDDYTRQKSLFGIEDDPAAVEIARKMEGTKKEFAAFMQAMNGGLKHAANGEADIFFGGVESREDILARMLNLKKAIGNVIDFFRNLRAGKGPRFVKKAVPIRGVNGETELSERWMQESIEGIAPYAEDAGISETGMKVVAVDFDGVINSYTSGWNGPAGTDAPVLSAAESVQTLFNRGYKVIIFSTRANTEEGVNTIREYLRKHTENNELADTIEITGQKPIADMYIDDRAVPFTGDWEETLKRIEEFKPWTEKVPKISNEIINLPDGVYEGLRAAYTIKLNNGVTFPTITGIRCSWRNPMPCKVKIVAGTPYDFIEKSLTWSGYPLQGRAKVQGMDISIENKKGSVRSGTDKDGHEWSQKMGWDYGYIRGTVGKDKDHLDCFLGPDPESDRVFIVRQNDPVTGAYDEDKVMLGFENKEAAEKAYLSQYDRPGFLGGIVEMGIEEFKETIFDENNKGKRIEKGPFYRE